MRHRITFFVWTRAVREFCSAFGIPDDFRGVVPVSDFVFGPGIQSRISYLQVALDWSPDRPPSLKLWKKKSNVGDSFFRNVKNFDKKQQKNNSRNLKSFDTFQNSKIPWGIIFLDLQNIFSTLKHWTLGNFWEPECLSFSLNTILALVSKNNWPSDCVWKWGWDKG